ncbi:hypothetical protein [Desulfosporosinus fructosivorans]
MPKFDLTMSLTMMKLDDDIINSLFRCVGSHVTQAFLPEYRSPAGVSPVKPKLVPNTTTYSYLGQAVYRRLSRFSSQSHMM